MSSRQANYTPYPDYLDQLQKNELESGAGRWPNAETAARTADVAHAPSAAVPGLRAAMITHREPRGFGNRLARRMRAARRSLRSSA